MYQPGENVLLRDRLKFMATADAKEVQQLYNEVEAVRKESANTGLAFLFYTHPDGKTTCLMQKIKKHEQAFMMSRMSRDPSDSMSETLKWEITFEEREQHFKEE